MTRPVSIAMYEPGGAANAALWDGLRAYLAADGVNDLPEDLTVPADYETTWLDPHLLLSQTCGYPLRHRLERRVRYVGTPVYEVDGTDGPFYRSAIVVRAGDPAEALVELRGRRAAYNGLTSQSGYNAFRDLVAPLARHGRFFANVIETGSHAASLRAVIADKADIAAIDPVSLALEPAEIRKAIKVIGWSEATPGLPYITGAASKGEDVNTLRRNISSAFSDPLIAGPRTYLKLSGFHILDETAYDSILAMEHRALDRGYPLLA